MRDARPTYSRRSVAFRIFLAGCLLSALAAAALYQWDRISTLRQIDDQAGNLEAKIHARFAAYLALLRGAAGFFSTEGWVTRAHFHRYFSQVEVLQNYPGVQGVGLTLRLAPDQVSAVTGRARQDGWPAFRVWPADPRPEYHAIVFLEPEDERNRAAIGYDMHTEPVRRAAMDRARDTGRPTVTGKVTLVQEINSTKQPGFLLYVPFYDNGERPPTESERRQRLAGFAYAAFRVGDFMAALVEPMNLRGVTVTLYDAPTTADAALIYRNAGAHEPGRPGALVERKRQVRILDRTWTLVATAEPKALLSPIPIALFGFIASAGLAVLVHSFERARRRADLSEAATRAREGELALLVDAVPALVTYIDREGVYRLCNHRYAEWFGVEPQAIIGRRVADVVGTELYASLEPNIRKALAGEGVSFERWYSIPGLGARYLGTIYVPHRGENGDIIGLYALSSDLTAHKRAEEAARFVADCGKLLIASMDVESTARGIVHLAVPRVADVAVLFRAEGSELHAKAVAHVRDEMERQLGQFLEGVKLSTGATHNIAMAARTGMVVVSPQINPEELARTIQDDAQRQAAAALQLRSALHVPVVVRGRIWAVFSFGTSADTGRVFTDEHRQLADEISTRVRLAVENATLYREAQQEIEDRRRAERVARETEERFRLLVEGVRDYAIVALDGSGRIESWNEGAQRILGYAGPDVIGTSPAQFYLPDDQQAGIPDREFAHAREHGASSDERWFTRKDASRFWASSHVVVLREEHDVRGFAWIMRDLTDRKRMEDELERRVQLRTTELNEAVEELEAFSYSVSHDLRAPLRTIRGFTELALEEAGPRLNAEEKGYLDRVHRASGRLDRLISDLLAYTRVSKTKVELRRVDLHALVSDIQREHPEFQPPRADVRIEGHLLPAIGNEAYLTQCITNLVGNAVKFVREGHSAVVRIWTEQRGDMVRLYVRDNGIGIAPERITRAFEMFERLHTAGSYEGTGVGLAIVRRAVQRMKGNVGVDSKLGEGTTFWIELQRSE